MRYLRDLGRKSISGKTCLLRTDYNIEDPKEALRLEASLETIKFLLKNGARVVILSHRGRPRGLDKNFSLKFLVPFLTKRLNEPVSFMPEIAPKLPSGKLILMENLRFYPEEDADDRNFAKQLARLGDFYVNDAFAVCHRANSSITRLPGLLPSYAGFLLEKEIKTLSKVMKNPEKPLAIIFGGSKVSDKIPAIKNLLSKATVVLLGSSAIGKVTPNSKKIIKPIDWLAENNSAMDIGPMTLEQYLQEIKKARTIIWNGPVGKFEDKKFANGSIGLAKAIAKSKAFTVIGGGETTQLILRLGLEKQIGFLSTGGGAMLEFLAGKKLPGIQALG